jgi:hypothetical protein
MPDTASKKANVISRTVANSEAILDNLAAALRLRQEALDSGFGPGGTDAITDADFTGENAHVNLTRFLDAFTVFAALDTALAANSRAHYIRLQLLHR